jgi:transcriptional regulator with XRE-family HTH domain
MILAIDQIWSILSGMDVGALLRETRRERGLDQAELARRAGTTQGYISRVERGTISPTLRTLERLMHAMGRRLVTATEPLAPGNASVPQLRADYRELSPAARVQRAMELSAFLTRVAASAPARDERHP